jgi:hypothetical protein
MVEYPVHFNHLEKKVNDGEENLWSSGHDIGGGRILMQLPFHE